MGHHRADGGEHGSGFSRRHVLARMNVTALSSMAPRLLVAPRFLVAPRLLVALDTGDADEFTFATAGDVACFGGFRPRRQDEITVLA
ncbi:hypothetical protein FJ930_00860 [Mesorhizobium sp. B2-4-15]|uniref:hypothetical protein n=1 Tax=Mesorhizobium sp. B2-4-15 TaxID=2589934 RepID=UPI00114D604D|nr:hypothetical protein [Mesorhizobium sp. B2-4-15]TPK77212.1 hypothetical protein FJ930_00860 [Mesorhizobium sp. B2-4-15]